jgi:predicted metal-dependent hydrolase
MAVTSELVDAVPLSVHSTSMSAGQQADHEGEVIVVTLHETPAGIQVRYPEFDFSSTPVVWGPNAEVALRWNAGSLVTTPIEVFLLKVMRKAKAEMDERADGGLLRDMDLFNKQEAQHFKTHAAFNKVTREWCPEVAAIELAFEDDLNEFLESKPLRWLVGYCEAFEALGGLISVDWVDGHNAESAGTFDSAVVEMWRWHLAEEYEHREVMWRVYDRLFGTPADVAYDFRIEMFTLAGGHFGGYAERMFQAMLATYRKEMTADELRASREREERFVTELQERTERRTEPVFSREYNPTTNPRPAQLDDVLATYAGERY